MKLFSLKAKEIGVIEKIDGNSLEAKRIENMGFRIGEKIIYLWRAPFKKYYAYQVQGKIIAISKELSEKIIIKRNLEDHEK